MPVVSARPRRQTRRPDMSFGDMSRKRVQVLVFMALNIAIVAAAIVFFDKWDSFLGVLGRVEMSTVLAVAGLALVNYVLRARRYQYLNRQVGAELPFRDAFLYYVAGFSFSVTPGKIGELVRAWFIREAYGYPLRQLAPAIFVDRLGDVLATLILCASTVGLFSGHLLPLAAAGLLMAGGVLALTNRRLTGVGIAILAAAMRMRLRIVAAIRRMIRNVSLLLAPTPMSISLFFGVLAWLAEGVAFYFCVTQLGGEISLASAIFIFAFANLVGGLTFLPGGIGGTEITMLTLLYSVDVPPEIAMAATVLIRAGTLWFGVGLGFLASIAASRAVQAAGAAAKRAAEASSGQPAAERRLVASAIPAKAA